MKAKSKVLDEVIDDDPDADVPETPAKPTAKDWPWKYVVKHRGCGALRVHRDEASTEDEALEVYRQRQCPHVTTETLRASGVRVGTMKFIPADTER